MKKFLKKQSAGFFLSIAAIMISLIALLIYIINGLNAYYNDFNFKIVMLTIPAILIEIFIILLEHAFGEKRWLDVFHLIPPVLLAIAVVAFISVRVESAGIILGSELEKGNMVARQSLTQAFIGIGLYLAAMITSFTKSFYAQLKQ